MMFSISHQMRLHSLMHTLVKE